MYVDEQITITIPWPPSVNKLWRVWNRRIILSTEARDYKRTIKQLYYTWDKVNLDGRLKILINAFPPDKRDRDLDNLLKITLDSLQGAGLFKNDSKFDDVHILRNKTVKGGILEVYIGKMPL